MSLCTAPSAIDVVRGGEWSCQKYVLQNFGQILGVFLSQIARLRKS